jgi:predicted ATPase
MGLSYAAWALWFLGYPNQALKRIHDALTLAHELSHPFDLAYALGCAAIFHQFRGEWQATQEWAEAEIALCNEQGFAYRLAMGTILRGWALARQGQGKEGIAQMRQGLAAWRATGAELVRPYYLALLAEAYGKVGQAGEGLTALTEALELVHKTEERWHEAELYRLRGELTLQQASQKSKVKTQKFQNPNPKA